MKYKLEISKACVDVEKEKKIINSHKIMVEFVQAKFVRRGAIESIVIGTESQSYKHFTEENKHHFNVPDFVYI